jgi:hypothetical protein
VDGGTGQIELTAISGGLAQLASFEFSNKSFLASSVPGGITYKYTTGDVSSLSYTITGSDFSTLHLLDLSTSVISGVLPPGVDPGIQNHSVFGPQGGVLPPNGFASGSACSDPTAQGCSAFYTGTFDALATPEPASLLLLATSIAGMTLASLDHAAKRRTGKEPAGDSGNA